MMRALLLFLVLAAPPAHAENDVRARARARFDEAQLDYKLGRFDEALEGYRSAYELVAHPDLLFNIGQCYRQMGNCERALFFYRQFLEDAPQAENRPLVMELIAECERIEPPAPPPPEPPPPAAPPPAPPPIAAPPPPAPPAPLVETEVQDEPAPIYTTWWFWTATAAVVAAAAAVAVIATLPGEEQQPPPGTLGTFDWTE